MSDPGKSFLTRLVTSPSGKGFRDSPLLYFFLGGGALVLLLDALVTGELRVIRSNTPIYYRTAPRFFVFSWLFQLSLGALFTWLGLRKWRGHDE